jgi:hypothetical protein
MSIHGSLYPITYPANTIPKFAIIFHNIFRILTLFFPIFLMVCGDEKTVLMGKFVNFRNIIFKLFSRKYSLTTSSSL